MGCNVETWKDIPGFEGYYQASNMGRVKSLGRQVTYGRGVSRWKEESILTPTNKGNNPCYTLCVEGRKTPMTINDIFSITFGNEFNNPYKEVDVVSFTDSPLATIGSENAIWKDVPGFETCYQFSNEGFLRGKNRTIKGRNYQSTILKLLQNGSKYYYSLSKNNRCYGKSINSLAELVFGGTNVPVDISKAINYYFSNDTTEANTSVNTSNEDVKTVQSTNIVEMVEWQDMEKAFAINNRWVSKENIAFDCNVTKYMSCGFLLEETEDSIVIANTLRGEDVLNPLMIMKSAIIKRQRLSGNAQKEVVSYNNMNSNSMSNNMNNISMFVRKTPVQLSTEQVKSLLLDYLNGTSQTELAKKYNISQSCVNHKLRSLLKSGKLFNKPKIKRQKINYTDTFMRDSLYLDRHAFISKYGVSNSTFNRTKAKAKMQYGI
jgi:predicted DNA-binding protein (UPF0251 family)